MSAKQKMTIAITALCLIAIVAVVTVIAVFAASQQTFTSQISVSYTVEDVQCLVSAKYYGGKENPVETGKEMKDPKGEKTQLQFGIGTNEETTLQPQEGDVVLTSTDKFVIFEYKFQNDSSEHAFTAALQFEGTAKNVKVTTNETGSKLTPASDFTAEQADAEQAETNFPTVKQVTENPNFTIGEVTVAASQTVYIYVRVEIAEIAADANFVGAFNWTLKHVGK